MVLLSETTAAAIDLSTTFTTCRDYLGAFVGLEVIS